MRKVVRRGILGVVAVLIAVAGVVLILNWTPRKYHVTGTITRAGKPLEWEAEGERRELLIIFAPTDRERYREIYRCTGDPDKGTYAIDVPANEYRISIKQLDPYPGKRDLLKLAFDVGTSPIFRTVTGNGVINIDLPRELPKTAKSGPGS